LLTPSFVRSSSRKVLAANREPRELRAALAVPAQPPRLGPAPPRCSLRHFQELHQAALAADRGD